MGGPSAGNEHVGMRAEIISVGTELLLGSIVDTNAAYLAQRLAHLGIDCFYVSAVGDNLGRLAETLGRAFRRSDLVVCTGGLGPTGDDLTREAVAAVLDEEPYVVPALEGVLRAFFARRGMHMPQRNIKQATLIPSARAIANPVGTAPGWWVESEIEGARRAGIFMPGVPFEMKRMWEHEVEPALRARSGMVLVSRVLKVLGAGESAVEEKVADLMDGANPTLAPYAKSDGIYLRISAKADSQDRAQEMIGDLESRVRERLGDLIYGVDSDTPYIAVGKLAKALGISYGVLEIGPGVAGALIPGLSGASGFTDGIAAPTLSEASAMFGAECEELAAVARAVASRTGVGMVIVLLADLTRVEGDESIARADVEVRIFSAGGEQLARQRQSWQIPPGEVPRIAGLLALNLLRLRLLKIQRGEASKVAD